MTVPDWFLMMIGGLVLVYGVFRLRLGILPGEVYQARHDHGQMYRIAQRKHWFIGFVMLVFGALLLARGAGFDPLSTL